MVNLVFKLNHILLCRGGSWNWTLCFILLSFWWHCIESAWREVKKEVCCACKFTEVMWQTVCVYLKLSFSFFSVDIAKDLLYNYPREFASIWRGYATYSFLVLKGKTFNTQEENCNKLKLGVRGVPESRSLFLQLPRMLTTSEYLI